MMYFPSPALQATHGISHGFFTRRGGVSTGIFQELNCGGWGSTEPTAIIAENRRRVALEMGTEPAKLLSVHQIHGTQVVTVTQPWDMNTRPQADAMVTAVPGFGLGILTADCAPVLFFDPQNRIIGAAHAGWKGAFAGVLAATVTAMEALGAQRAEIIAAIGPTIAQASYEVDGAFYQRFMHTESSNQQFFVANAANRYQFDLPRYVDRQLSALSIKQVDRLSRDTYQEEDAFFSFRRATHRGEPDYGRQLSVIALY